MLTRRGAAAFPAADDLGLAIDHLAEQLKIFVVDIHRPGAFTVYEDRVFLFDLRLRLRPLAGCFGKTLSTWHRTH